MSRSGLAAAARVARWSDTALGPVGDSATADGKATLSDATAERAALALGLTPAQVRADWDTARLAQVRPLVTVDADGTGRVDVHLALDRAADRDYTALVKVGERARGARHVPVPVPALYTAPDGTERRGDAHVLGPRPAGATVSIWVDRSGAITSRPPRALDAVESAAAGAGGVLAVGAVVLGGIWMGVRAVLLRLNMARWAREWEQVEPQWSGNRR